MKDIKGFERLYSITEDGKVFSHVRGIYLAPKIDRYGYEAVVLSKRGVKTYTTVHRLVALTYVSGWSEELVVNHKDGNKLNNAYANLEWTTVKENTQHAYDNGLAKAWNKGKTGIYSEAVIESNKANQDSKAVIVMDGDGNEVSRHRSVREMCEVMGFDRTAMRVLKGQKSYNTINGYKLKTA